jgi:hypothetical protein
MSEGTICVNASNTIDWAEVLKGVEEGKLSLQPQGEPVAILTSSGSSAGIGPWYVPVQPTFQPLMPYQPANIQPVWPPTVYVPDPAVMSELAALKLKVQELEAQIAELMPKKEQLTGEPDVSKGRQLDI